MLVHFFSHSLDQKLHLARALPVLPKRVRGKPERGDDEQAEKQRQESAQGHDWSFSHRK